MVDADLSALQLSNLEILIRLIFAMGIGALIGNNQDITRTGNHVDIYLSVY